MSDAEIWALEDAIRALKREVERLKEVVEELRKRLTLAGL